MMQLNYLQPALPKGKFNLQSQQIAISRPEDKFSAKRKFYLLNVSFLR